MRISRLLLLCALLMALVVPVAVSAQSGPPYVGYFTPSVGSAGTLVKLYGSNLTLYTSVYFNYSYAPVVRVDPQGYIEVRVPSGASTGPLVVGNSYGSSSPGTFYVPVTPHINSLSPNRALPGASVTINGSGFEFVSSVTLNGSPVSYTVNSTGRITFTVPAGATSGPVVVTTSFGGSSNAVTFTVIVPVTKTGITRGLGTSNCYMISPNYPYPSYMYVSVTSSTDIDLQAFENYQTWRILQQGYGQPTNVYYAPPTSGSFMFCVMGLVNNNFTLTYWQ
jgi:hypothetical protein